MNYIDVKGRWGDFDTSAALDRFVDDWVADDMTDESLRDAEDALDALIVLRAWSHRYHAAAKWFRRERDEYRKGMEAAQAQARFAEAEAAMLEQENKLLRQDMERVKVWHT